MGAMFIHAQVVGAAEAVAERHRLEGESREPGSKQSPDSQCRAPGLPSRAILLPGPPSTGHSCAITFPVAS